jgi:hypothetical protein
MLLGLLVQVLVLVLVMSRWLPKQLQSCCILLHSSILSRSHQEMLVCSQVKNSFRPQRMLGQQLCQVDILHLRYRSMCTKRQELVQQLVLGQELAKSVLQA